MPIKRFDPEQPVGAPKPFTDRESFIAAFDAALATFDPRDEDQYRVLNYYGVGGIGKTALRKHLGALLDARKDGPMWSVVDFEGATLRTPEAALYEARTQLKKKYKLRFPTFDLAYAVLWEKMYPQQPLKASSLTGLVEGDLALDVLTAVEDIPGIGLLTKIPKALDKMGRQTREWWRKRGMATLRELPSLDANEVAERLPYCWGRDVAHLPNLDGQPVVFFLDTYEALWQGRRTEQFRYSLDAWVRELIAHTPGVLWVVTGRERLVWADIPEEGWGDYLDCKLVGKLSDEDARLFLSRAGIDDPGIQAALVEGRRAFRTTSI